MPWRYPLFDLDYGEEEKQAVIEVIQSGWITRGPKTLEYEEKLARYFGVKYALATSSGTTALHLAYLAAGIRPGMKVIVPSLTFVATVTPLLWIGALLLFVDIHSLKFPNISPESVEKLAPQADAVIFVHYAGFPDFIQDISKIAKKHDLILIEDASHAIGTKIDGKFAGTFGRVSAFSTFSNKNLSTGEGGFILTDDKRIYEKAKLLMSHGMTTTSYSKYSGSHPFYDVVEVGFNYRITEIHAVLGIVQLGKLDVKNERRRELVRKYRYELNDVEGLIIPFEDFENSANYIFPVILPDDTEREVVIKKMAEAGIQTSIHYPPIHKFRAFREIIGDLELPVTEEYARRTLTLPLYPSLNQEDIVYIINILKNSIQSDLFPSNSNY